ncbi:MAG: ATP-binding protein, partial [Nitrospirae bacterium]|nr:ATP-binding protein [Nitrospirota bacterium]
MTDDVPLYAFKASEFINTSNINDLFSDFTLQEFIDAHSHKNTKLIVIDSAETLLDLKIIDPFKEFFSALIKNKWQIIFTTRNNYLENLNYEFIEIHQIVPCNVDLQILELTELTEISQTYEFILPVDVKLLELIRNSFYLTEYLRFYNKKEQQIDYSFFKEKLWANIIVKAKPAREQCFLSIAFQRAKDGQLFVT